MERELKLVVADGGALEALAALPPLAGAALVERPLRATYHDTARGDLRRAGLSLRVRHDGTAHVQTVKAEGTAAAGLFVRPEWERVVNGGAPVVDAAAGPIAALIGDRPLEPRFSTDIRRRAGLIEWNGARMEVALDRGTLSAGDATASVAEVELELTDGPVAAVFALARHLAAQAPLRLGVRSKSERGAALADGPIAAAHKAEPVRLDRDGTVIDAFAAIAGNGLRQFRLNEDLLLSDGNNAAALHQGRVGLRRLRSAFSLFKPLLHGDPRAAELTAGLKDLAAALGDVRDLDVLIAAGSGPHGEALATARAEAFDRARARLEAGETLARLLDLAEWLAVGDWRLRPADPELAHGPVVPFAADVLDRARKRVKARGAHFMKLDDEARHRVRIEGKKLRYASEFFAGLWTGAKARTRADRFAETVERVQEELGRLNDRTHGAAVLARLGLAADPAPAVDRKMVKRAADALDALEKAKRFWR